MNLTSKMKKALLQIGFGVSGREGGFFDEEGERLDLRSAQALVQRGLIYYLTQGASPMRGCLLLTPLGNEVFEDIRYEGTQRKH